MRVASRTGWNIVGVVLVTSLCGQAVAAEGRTVPKLYWTPGNGNVHRANLDGSDQEIVYLKNSAGGREFVVDRQRQQIYIRTNRENGFIRFGYEGQDPELVFEFDHSLQSLAIDEAHRQLYWRSTSQVDSVARIWRNSLDGGEPELLVDDVGRVDVIVVDPAGEYYYWTDNRIDGLHRDATDGSGGGIINYGSELGIPGFRPNIEDIVIDPIGERLYIAEDAIDSIVSIALDGSDPKLLVTDEVVGPHAIAVDPIGGRMYWSNSVRLIAFDPNDPPGFGDDVFEPSEYNYAVMSANLDGSDVRKEFYSGLASNVPRDLAVIYVPVPEPETAALVVLTGGAACAAKWRSTCRQSVRCDDGRPGLLARIARRCFKRR